MASFKIIKRCLLAVGCVVVGIGFAQAASTCHDNESIDGFLIRCGKLIDGHPSNGFEFGIPADSIEKCIALCRERPSTCMAVSWSPSTCWLKSATGPIVSNSTTGNYQTGILKDCSGKDSSFKPYKLACDKTLTGAKLGDPIPMSSLKACTKRCTDDSTCVAVTFSHANQSCQRLATKGDEVPDLDSDSAWSTEDKGSALPTITETTTVVSTVTGECPCCVTSYI